VLILATSDGVAFITAVATLGAAVVLAGITAATTNNRLVKQLEDGRERQERSLNAEADRQRRALDAEAERQRAALAHARELADISDLRAILDEATLAIDQAIEARIQSAVRMTVRRGDTPEKVRERITDAEEKLDAARAAVAPSLARLRVRLGDEDALAKSVEEVDHSLLDMASDALLMRATSTMDEERETYRVSFDEHAEQFRKATQQFLASAVERAGTLVGSSV
jgi:hypothetical protein